MFKSLLLTLPILLLFAFNSSATEVDVCSSIMPNNNAVFNICSFDTTSPHLIKYQNGSSANFELTISLASPLVTPCSGDPTTKVFATFRDLFFANECFDLVIASPNASLPDSADEGDGLLLTYPTNPDSADQHQLSIDLICDEDAADGSKAGFMVDEVTEKIISLSVKSSSACPTKLLPLLVRFLTRNQYIFAALFMFLGIFLCLFGFQLLKYTVFVIGAVFGTFVSAVLLFLYTGEDMDFDKLWIIFAASLIIGGIIGALSVKLETFGFVVLGILAGVVGGSFLYNALLAPFFAGSPVVLDITRVILAVIGAGIAYKFWKDAVIVATSFIGAYLVVKGISMATTGCLLEESIAAGIRNWNATIYIYLVLILVIAVGSTFFQEKRKNKGASHSDSQAYSSISDKN